jgi:hypothetical protein
MRCLLNVFIAAALAVFVPASAIAGVSPTATIVGTVTLTTADGSAFPGEGARVTLSCAADGMTRTEVSDKQGAFRFSNVPVDTCSIKADVQGFAAPSVRVVTAADRIVGTDLHLAIAPLRVGVNVGGVVPLRGRKVLRKCCRSDAGRRLERSAKGCTP